MMLQTLYYSTISFHPNILVDAVSQCNYGSVPDNCALSSLHAITTWEFTPVWKTINYNTKSTCRIGLLYCVGLLVTHYYIRTSYISPSISTKRCPSPKFVYISRDTLVILWAIEDGFSKLNLAMFCVMRFLHFVHSVLSSSASLQSSSWVTSNNYFLSAYK